MSSTLNEAPSSPAQPPANAPIIIKISKSASGQPVIAEATSSADDAYVVKQESPEPSLEYAADDEYSSNMEAQEGTSTRWYHEHDYLKNVVEPEPSGLENIDEPFESDAVESEIEECPIENNHETEMENRSMDFDNISRMTHMHDGVGGGSRINTYDVELPQDIFQKQEEFSASSHASPPVSLSNHFTHQPENTQVFVRQMIDPPCTNGYKGAVIIQEDHSKPINSNNDSYVLEPSDGEQGSCYKGST